MMKKLLLALALIIGAVPPMFGQEPTTTAEVPSTSAVQDNEKPEKPKKKKAGKSPWKAHVSLRSVFDSNIAQNEDDTNSHGFTMEAGVEYLQDLPSGSLGVSYALGEHTYTNTRIWDRTTHNLELALEQDLGRNWTSETIGEMALKDASDDGDIRDEYRLVQRLSYRLSPDYRVRLDAALRFKENSVDDEGKDARDPYLGILLERRFPRGGRARIGYRNDLNNAQDDRFSYRRSEVAASGVREFGKNDTVALEVAYQKRRYTDRYISTPQGTVNRRDRNWEIGAVWDHALGKDMALTLDYGFENRRSNDARREYDDHQFGTTLTHSW